MSNRQSFAVPRDEAHQHLKQAWAYKERTLLKRSLQECELAIQLAPSWAEAYNLRDAVRQELSQKAQDELKLTPHARVDHAIVRFVSFVITLAVLGIVLCGALALASTLRLTDDAMVDCAFGALATCGGVIVATRRCTAGVWDRIVRLKVLDPIASASTKRLHPGEIFRVDYRQMFRGAVQIKRIAVRLILREMAIRKIDTNLPVIGTQDTIKTCEHIVAKVERLGRRYQKDEPLEESFTLHIPDDAMHTLSGVNNKLRWLVRVNVIIAGWPDFNEEYEIKVLPEGKSL